MSNPFDSIGFLNTPEKNRDYSRYEEILNGFVPYMANKHFSYFRETVMLANEVNARHYLDKEVQFLFYLNTIRPMKRYSKWAKSDDREKLQLISDYYNLSYEKARQILHLFDEERLSKLQENLQKGGLEK